MDIYPSSNTTSLTHQGLYESCRSIIGLPLAFKVLGTQYIRASPRDVDMEVFTFNWTLARRGGIRSVVECAEMVEVKLQTMKEAEGKICWLSELREGKL